MDIRFVGEEEIPAIRFACRVSRTLNVNAGIGPIPQDKFEKIIFSFKCFSDFLKKNFELF